LLSGIGRTPLLDRQKDLDAFFRSQIAARLFVGRIGFGEASTFISVLGLMRAPPSG